MRVVLALSLVLLSGCPWHLPPPDCTTPSTDECVGNVPSRCMSNRVLRPIHAPCAPNETCVLAPGLVSPVSAMCVRTTDAGAGQ